MGDRQGSEAENFDIQQLIARFRANLVVMGAEPFEEDNWKHVVIGDLVFQVSCPISPHQYSFLTIKSR